MNDINAVLVKKNERLQWIDIYKGLAIVFVIITHCNWSDVQRKVLLFPYWIDMAVPIFMMLSGYVYSLSYRKNFQTLRDGYSKVRIIKSFLRYTIPFTIIYFIEMLVSIIYAKEMISITNLIKVFITGGLGPGSYYYPILIQMIFVFPIIYYVVLKFHHKGVIIMFIANVGYEIIKTVSGMPSGLYRLLIFRYIFILSIGSYLFLNNNFVQKKNYKYAYVISAIGFIFITLTAYSNYNAVIITEWQRTSVLAVLWIIPIFIYFVNQNIIRLGILAYIGKSSYHIFLIQMFYYALIYPTLDDIFLIPLVCALPLNIFICILFGILFYKLENPLNEKIMKLLLP